MWKEMIDKLYITNNPKYCHSYFQIHTIVQQSVYIHTVYKLYWSNTS